MLTCEKCAHDLIGGAVICRHCGFNNALRRVEKWREQRRTSVLPLRTAPEAPKPALKAQPMSRPAAPRERPVRPSMQDSTLIPFPSVHRSPAGGEQRKAEAPEARHAENHQAGDGSAAPAKPDVYPPWRKELSARVRQIREQKTAPSVEPPRERPAAEEFDRNPIIASALRRIRRVEYLPPVSPNRPPRATAATAAAQAAAPAPAPLEEADAEVAPLRRAPRPTVTQPAPLAPPVSEKPSAGVPRPVTKDASRVENTAVDVRAEIGEVLNPEGVTAEAQAVKLEAETGSSLSKAAATHPTPAKPVAPPSDRIIFTAGPKPKCMAAPLRQRAAAALIDAEAAAFGFLVIFAGAFVAADLPISGALNLALIITAAVLIPVYYVVSFAFVGRTLGMSLLKLRVGRQVVEEDVGSAQGVSRQYEIAQLTLPDILARTLGSAASLVLFPLNLLSIWRSDERPSLADRLSGTCVVSFGRKQDAH